MIAIGSRELAAGVATLNAASTLEAAVMFSPLFTTRFIPHLDHFRAKLLDSAAFSVALERLQPFIEQGRAFTPDSPPSLRLVFADLGRALAQRITSSDRSIQSSVRRHSALASAQAPASTDVTDPRPAVRFWFRAAPYEPSGRWPMEMLVGASPERGNTAVRVRVRNPGGRALQFRVHAANGSPAGPAVTVSDAKPAGLGDVAFQAALLLATDMDRPAYEAIGSHVLGLESFYRTVEVPVDVDAAARHWGSVPALQLRMLQSAWGSNDGLTDPEAGELEALRKQYASRLVSHLIGMTLQLIGSSMTNRGVSECVNLAVSKVGTILISRPSTFKDSGLLGIQTMLDGSLIPCLQQRGELTLAARLGKLSILSLDAAASQLTALADAGLFAAWVTSAVLDSPRYTWTLRQTWLTSLSFASPSGGPLPDRVNVGDRVAFELQTFLGSSRVAVGVTPPGVTLRMTGGESSAGQLEQSSMYAVRNGTMSVDAEALVRDTTGTRTYTSSVVRVGGCPFVRLTRLTHSFGTDNLGITFRIDTTFFVAYGIADVRCDPSQSERQVAPEQLEWIREAGPTSGNFVSVSDQQGKLAGFSASGAAGRWSFRGRLWSAPLADGSRRLLDDQRLDVSAGPGSIGGIIAPSSFMIGNGAIIAGSFFDVRSRPRSVQVCARGYGLQFNSWGSCNFVNAISPGIKSYQLYAPAIPEVFSAQVFVTAIEPR